MKKTFDNLLESYKQLLEQDIPPVADDATAQAPTGDPTQQAAPAVPEPNKPEPTSVGYATMAQLVLDAFKTMNIKNKTDIKFSDNVIRSPQEAYKYLEIIKRNLSPDLQRNAQRDFGQGGQQNDLDSASLINLTSLALQALFFIPKREETETGEFANISSIAKVDTNNARQVVNDIRNYLSQRI